MLGRTAVATLSLAGALFAQPVEQIAARMKENIRRAPNYTCLETTDRWRKGEPCSECESRDRIRLEVAVIDGRERFSWPGAGAFELNDIFDLVGFGTMSSGDFSGLAKMLFFQDRPAFEAAGNVTIDGRRALRFTFSVPAAGSSFIISNGKDRDITAYHGAFWVDPDNLDVLRLEFTGDNPPARQLVQQLYTRIDYSRRRIGSADHLLPSAVHTRTVTPRGAVNQNVAVFSNCRQYSGESTIRFGGEDEAAASSTASAPRHEAAPLPPGIPFAATLEAPISLEDCAVGDPVRLIVSKGGKQGSTQIPKKAVIHARVVGMEAQIRMRYADYIALRVMEIEIAGKRLPLRAGLKQAVGHVDRTRLGQFEVRVKDANATIFLPPRQNSLPKGLVTDWVTQ